MKPNQEEAKTEEWNLQLLSNNIAKIRAKAQYAPVFINPGLKAGVSNTHTKGFSPEIKKAQL